MEDNFLVLTIDAIPGQPIHVVGPVMSACCMSKSAAADLLANLKNWSVGGELNAYTLMLDKATQTVTDRLAEQARSMGADAVIGFRLVTSSVATGAAELIGYGTAVRFET